MARGVAIRLLLLLLLVVLLLELSTPFAITCRCAVGLFRAAAPTTASARLCNTPPGDFPRLAAKLPDLLSLEARRSLCSEDEVEDDDDEVERDDVEEDEELVEPSELEDDDEDEARAVAPRTRLVDGGAAPTTARDGLRLVFERLVPLLMPVATSVALRGVVEADAPAYTWASML